MEQLLSVSSFLAVQPEASLVMRTLDSALLLYRATASFCFRCGFGIRRSSANESPLGLFWLGFGVSVYIRCDRYIRAKVSQLAIFLHVLALDFTRSGGESDTALIFDRVKSAYSAEMSSSWFLRAREKKKNFRYSRAKKCLSFYVPAVAQIVACMCLILLRSNASC